MHSEMLCLALERRIEFFHGFRPYEYKRLAFARNASRTEATAYLHESIHCLRNYAALEHRHKAPVKLFLSGGHFEPILKTNTNVIPSNIDFSLDPADKDWTTVYQNHHPVDAGYFDGIIEVTLE